MGYDIRITRQENWFDDNAKNRISLEEWKDFLSGDPEMRIDNSAEAKTKSNEIIRAESEGLSVWTKYSGNGLDRNFAWFDYNKGNIVCKNADEEIITKMLDIANRLNAKVQGDDGELYEQSENKKNTSKLPTDEESNQIEQQKPWWRFW